MKPNTKLSRTEWRKTPYAETEARNPDTAILELLRQRGVKDIQPTYTTGPNGRPFYSIRSREIAGRLGITQRHANRLLEDFKPRAAA